MAYCTAGEEVTLARRTAVTFRMYVNDYGEAGLMPFVFVT